MGYNPKNHRYWMTIKKLVGLAMFKFCPPKSSIFWCVKKSRKMVFLSIIKKKCWTAPTLQGNVFLPLKQKTIFLPSSSFKFIFYLLQCCYNSTVLHVGKKPIDTVLILQYFKRVWYREINKTTVLQKRETYLMLLTFLLWFSCFP